MSARSVLFTAPAPKATMPSWSSKPSFLAACEASGESGGASTACGTKFHCYAGRHVDLRRLEARDDLGALVWQAGEGARVHRRLRQRGRGVAGSLYEEHLWESEGLIANLALSEARRELQFFLQLVLYGSVTPQTAVWRRRSMRLQKKPQEHDCVSQKIELLLDPLRPEMAPANRPSPFSSRAEEPEASGLITPKPDR